MVIVVWNGIGDPISISWLDCVSLSANTFENGMILYILRLAVGHIGLFSLDKTTSQEEGKLWIQTCLKLTLYHILPVAEELRK